MYILNRNIGIITICLLAFSTISCKKFLASYSQNNSFLESIEDVEELLLGDVYIDFSKTAQPANLYTMDDDVELGRPNTNYNHIQNYGFRFWQAEPRLNVYGQLENQDAFFNYLYKKIANANTVIESRSALLPNASDVNKLNSISGEAHYLRAFYYFMLANIYGKPYRVATAPVDFSVPLKTDPTVMDQFVARSTNQKVFEQIIDDLLQAEKLFSNANQFSSIRANLSSTHALLSRVYLYMENYTQALFFADKVIALPQLQITDLNGHSTAENFLNIRSKEAIFTMGTTRPAGNITSSLNSYFFPYDIVSNDLISSYLPKDLRLTHFFLRNNRGEMRMAKKGKSNATSIEVAETFHIRLSEIYLNKSEALVGLNRFEDARNILRELQRNRFKAVDMPVITTDDELLIQEIRHERRLELCGEEHRWFDLRRYAVNAKYPFSKTIKHRSVVFAGNSYIDNGYYELGTYDQDSSAYIVPIAQDEILFNQGLLTNEKRPIRPLKN